MCCRAGYDAAAAGATASDAELRIDLLHPGSGTRRTIWRVEDADKQLPPLDPKVEAGAQELVSHRFKPNCISQVVKKKHLVDKPNVLGTLLHHFNTLGNL